MFKIFTVFLFTLLLIGCHSSRENSTTTLADKNSLPNIILLIGDDQGYPYFGFMGADYVHTPNMDELAANGVLFTNGYVSDNHCRPSLQTLLTGILPIDFHNQNFSYMDAEIKKQEISADSIQAFREDFDRRALGFSKFNTLPKMLAKKGYVSFQGGNEST